MLIILYEGERHHGTDLETPTTIMLEFGIFILIFALVEWVYLLFVFRSSLTLDH